MVILKVIHMLARMALRSALKYEKKATKAEALSNAAWLQAKHLKRKSQEVDKLANKLKELV